MLAPAVAALVALGTAGPANAVDKTGASGEQHIWLHYDYAVTSDGTSYAPDPKGIDLVVQSFAAHSIDLHIDPEHAAVPMGVDVMVEFDVPGVNHNRCLADGNPFVGFSTIKSQYFHPIANHEWHYAFFAPAGSICRAPGGVAQLPGDNFAIAEEAPDHLGNLASFIDGGDFMHELGHNLGLHHGGDVDANYKPNYLSVMNYAFQTGIPYAKTPGSTDLAGFRLDYSDQALPTLDENHLNEHDGIGATGSTDISGYCDSTNWPNCAVVPTSGPVDWNRDGIISPDVRDDLDFGLCQTFGAGVACGYEQMTGFDDWAEVHAYLAGLTDAGPRQFVIEPASDRPLVTEVNPAKGPSTGGTNVTITGVHLQNVDAVSFGPCPAAAFTVTNEHAITATAPACPNAGFTSTGMAAATVDVTAAVGGATSPFTPGDHFTYERPGP
jgi:hypothetical protein